MKSECFHHAFQIFCIFCRLCIYDDEKISIVTNIDFLKLTLFAHASEIYCYIFFMELSMLLIVEVCYLQKIYIANSL